jgi:hypothetical protein
LWIWLRDEEKLSCTKRMAKLTNRVQEMPVGPN